MATARDARARTVIMKVMLTTMSDLISGYCLVREHRLYVTFGSALWDTLGAQQGTTIQRTSIWVT